MFVCFSFVSSALCFVTRKRIDETFGRDLFFFLFLCPTINTFECSFAANQIKRKNGILRVRINISGSLSGFECGDEAGTKSIDECIDESDSVVVDLCD